MFIPGPASSLAPPAPYSGQRLSAGQHVARAAKKQVAIGQRSAVCHKSRHDLSHGRLQILARPPLGVRGFHSRLPGPHQRSLREVYVLRENSVPTDSVGFLGFWTPCFRHEDFACDHGRAVPQSGHLLVVQSGGRAADPRTQTATHRVQAQVEETNAKKISITVPPSGGCTERGSGASSSDAKRVLAP